MFILYLFLNICYVYDKMFIFYFWLMFIFKLYRKTFSDTWLRNVTFYMLY